jgi:hypothetical protein
MSDKDLLLQQAVGQMIESNRVIASSMVDIKDNLKTLNDHNILHAEKNNADHADILEKVVMMTGKYWYLIIALLVTILIIMGYQEAAKVFITG